MMAQINKSECLQIIKRATEDENVNILEHNVEKFGSYLGHLGEYYRLKIVANVSNQAKSFNFFVKCLPTRDIKQRNMLIETGIFRKEANLYERLLKELMNSAARHEIDAWCPIAYLCRDDFMVLEDLSLKNYEMLPFHVKFTQSHLEETLKVLARFHSCSIWYEMKCPNKIEKEIGDILFETSIDDISWYHAGLVTIYAVALNKTQFGRENQKLIEDDFYQRIFESIANMESCPTDVIKVLVHRDVWKNNLMFRLNDKNEPIHCVLLDFQTARYLAITIDFMMALNCTNKRNSHETFESYMMYYYKLLKNELYKFDIDLCTKMSFESFKNGCEYHKLVAFVYNAIVVQITHLPREHFESYTEDEYRDFADGNRSKHILKFMDKDSIYSDRLIEAVEDILNYLYK